MIHSSVYKNGEEGGGGISDSYTCWLDYVMLGSHIVFTLRHSQQNTEDLDISIGSTI